MIDRALKEQTMKEDDKSLCSKNEELVSWYQLGCGWLPVTELLTSRKKISETNIFTYPITPIYSVKVYVCTLFFYNISHWKSQFWASHQGEEV